MKPFQLIAILSLIVSTAKAQQNLSPGQNDLLKKLLNQNFQFHKKSEDAANIKELLALNNEQKPTFLYQTEKGKIYASPPDKMPFLSPEFHSNMPVDKRSPGVYIPNALNSKK